VLHSRVARSNALLLRTLGAEVTLVAPPTLLPVGVETWPVETSYDLDAVLPKADAVMMLRVQRERMNGGFFPTAREYSRRYGLDGAGWRRSRTTRSSCTPGRWSAAWRSPPTWPTPTAR
jgi:aspartate carbamoyltransferase catalytic subunit